MLLGTICFSVAAYGHFYDGEILMGSLCAAAAVLDLIAALLNYRKYRKTKEEQNRDSQL